MPKYLSVKYLLILKQNGTLNLAIQEIDFGGIHCGGSPGEAGHPDATDLTRDFSPVNSDATDILTLGLGRVLGLELGRQDVHGLKNTGVIFLASDRSRQDVADPLLGGGSTPNLCQNIS